jgi:bacterioferritin (cytochrome b1)
MNNIKEELINLINQALRLEHAARLQYLSHAENIKGPGSEKIIERLKEIAGDEAEHEEKFRTLIGSYLDGKNPTMEVDETHEADELNQIFEVNLAQEKKAVDFYKQIYRKAADNKEQLEYIFETVEHTLRHIIIDEQEHIAELKQLLGH